MATGGAPEMQGIGPGGAAQPAQGVYPVPDEQSDKENMENQRDLLIERMESEFGLLDKLRKSLTVIEIAELNSKPTTFEINKRLLELIFEKNKHQDLIRALTETRQMHLVNWVRGNGEYRIEFVLDWPLRKKEIEILEENHENWTDVLDTCGLLTLLFSKKVINRRQMDFIDSKPTTYKKNEELLNILRRCSLTAYFITIECLRTSNQDHIADVLDGKGAIVQAHANLDAERLDETETRIVREMTSLVLQYVPENRTSLLLQELQIQIIASRRGSSIVLYIYCKTMDELTYLCEVINNKELKDRIENLFNALLRDMVTRVIGLYIAETEINKAKKCFEREASHDKLDEDISRLRAQMQHDPVQERTPGKHSSEEDESLLLEQKKQPTVGSEEEKLETEKKQESDDDGDEDSDDDEGEEEEGVHGSGASAKEMELQAPGYSDVAKELGKMELSVSERTRMDIIAAIIRNNTDYLTEYMRPEGLVDKLHATECLTDDDTRYIKTLKHRTEKNDEILNVIDDDKKYNDLINCLRQTKQDLAADVVEKGGVVLKTKVTFKQVSLPDVEKRLVEIIGTLQDKSVPKRDEVVQFLSKLRRGSIEILDARYEKGVVVWLWCRSEGALRKVFSMYKSKKLNKLLLSFFDLLINRQTDAAIRTDIEDTEMEFAAWPPKLNLKHPLPVGEGVVCSITTLPQKFFVLCQNPSKVLVFENKDYSKESKQIPVEEITDPVDIVASHQVACLYVTDVASSSIWKITTDDGKVTQWLQDVGNPYTLSLTTGGEVVMVRRGPPSTLEIYGPDGKKLHDIKLPPNISLPNHAVGTSSGTFFVSNGKENAKFTGIFEIDKGGNTISYLDFGYEPIVHLSGEVNSILKELCEETQLGYPRYLALSKKNQLLSADFQNGGVMVFDLQLYLEQIFGKDDVKQTLRLCCTEEDNELVVVHGEKRVIGIYEFSSDVAEEM